MKKKYQILIAIVALFATIGVTQAYTVVEGDNMTKIAERADKSLVELAKLNPQVTNLDLIYVGDEIDTGEEYLGGTTPISGGTYTLAGSGISSTATSIILSSLTFTQTGREIITGDLPDIFYVTVEPGSRSRQEIVSCTTVAQSATGSSATLSGCVRGLTPFSPYTTDSDYKFSHSGGSQVILSDPPQLFNLYTAKDNNETVTGYWDFTALPSSAVAPTSTDHFVNKTYVDNSVNQGAATSTPTVAGISELATQNETASSTAWGITEPHVIQSQYATSTPSGGTSAAKYVVVSEADGKINQLWLDLTEVFTFRNNVNFFDQVDIPGDNVYTNYLGASFNIGWSAVTMENATGTLNVLGDTFITGNATTTGDLDIEGDINDSSINNNYYSTASDNLKVSEDSEDTTTSGTFALLKTIRINTTGGARVKYDIKTDSNAITSQLWKNGTYVGSGQYDGSDTSFVTQSIDLTFLHTGDVLQVYAKHGGAGATITAKNFRVYFDVSDLGQYGVGLD